MTTSAPTYLDAAIAAMNLIAQSLPLPLPDPYGLGQDLQDSPDFDQLMSELAGFALLAQDFINRLITPRGSLPDDPDYGTDARDDISAGLTPADWNGLAAKYSAELSKDDRVSRVDATVLLSTADTLQVQFTVLIGTTPFRFTATISQAYALVTGVFNGS